MFMHYLVGKEFCRQYPLYVYITTEQKIARLYGPATTHRECMLKRHPEWIYGLEINLEGSRLINNLINTKKILLLKVKNEISKFSLIKR